MDLCFLWCLPDAAQFLWIVLVELVPRLWCFWRLSILRCTTQLSYTSHNSNCTFAFIRLRLFVWLVFNLPMEKWALSAELTSRFRFTELTLGRMPRLTRRLGASTFQEVFAWLSVGLPRRTPASEAPFSRRTSTSWCLWLNFWCLFCTLEDDGEEKQRSETSITKFWRQTWENRNRCSGQESQGIKWCWKRKRYFVSIGKQNGSVRVETSVVSGTTVMSVQNRHQKPLHPLSHQHQEVEVRGEEGASEAGVRLGRQIDSRAKSSWKVLALKYWHPPEGQFHESQSGCKFGKERSFPHWKVEEQTNKKPKKGWWQKCSSHSVRCTTVGLRTRRTPSRRNPHRFYGRAPKSWDQFDGYDSQELRCVRQTSEKTKVYRLIIYKSKFLISAVPTLWNLRTDLRRRLKDKSDAPAETRGDLPRISFSSKKGQVYILFAYQWVEFAGRIHNKPEEREFVVDSRASMHMVSRQREC